MKVKIGLISFMALSACASNYQSVGFTGGFQEIQLAPNIYRVTFQGNAYTNKTRASDLALLRSADITMQKGFKFFALAEASSTTNYGAIRSPTTTNFHGNTATTTGGDVVFIQKPTNTNLVIMMNDRPEGQFVYEASLICESVGKKYKVTCGSAPLQ